MSAFFGTSLDINLRPSRRLAWVLFASHAGALVCTLISSAPLAVKVLFPLLLVAGLVYTLRRYARLTHPRSARRLVFGQERQRLLFADDRYDADVEVLPGTVNSGSWVILRVKPAEGRRLALPLVPDMMGGDQWRRLRVWLNVNSDARGKEQDTS